MTMTEPPTLTRLTPLIEEATSIGGIDDLGRVLRALVSEAKAATGAPYAAIGVIGNHGVLSEFIYDGISAEGATAIGHPPTGRGVLGALIREHTTLVLDRISDHPDSVGFPENHPAMVTFLGVPIAVGREGFGNLYLTDKPGGFTEDDVAVVEALSRIAGAAVQTARLQTRLRQIAVVEDRQRIARDLHDSVIQDLFAVGLGLQGVSARVDDPGTAAAIHTAIDTLDDSVNALRRYIFELRELEEPALSLEDRLRALIARMGAVYPAEIRLEVQGRPDGPWDDDLVLLVTESLSNALRHSQTETVEIRLVRTEHDLTLSVVDTGTGFETGRSTPGMGMANMRARALSMGGSVVVKSRPGDGTMVQVLIPVSRSVSREPGHSPGDPPSS
jgi:signal transduction histidine kinase